MATKKSLLFTIVVLVLIVSASVSAEEASTGNFRLSFQGGLGVSGARGDYPSEYDAQSQFSFYPGLRLRVDDTFIQNTFLLFDVGYMETGFKGSVAATDSTFNNTYEYININAMFGSSSNNIYYAAGLYLGIGLDAYSYREYTDETVTLDSNGDFGIVAEAGVELASFFSLGVQLHYGLKSIATSVDIKNWAILGTFGIHLLRF